jgi:hypothetical protein
MCQYRYGNHKECSEINYPGSDYCILHINFPEYRGSKEWKTLDNLKQEFFQKEIKKDDFNFEGGIFGNLNYNGIFKNLLILKIRSF